VVERNKRKHASLHQETENLEIFAVPSLVTQKKYSNDNCIVLVIISISCIAFPHHGHWSHALLFFCDNFEHLSLSHVISYLCASFTKNGSSSTQ